MTIANVIFTFFLKRLRFLTHPIVVFVLMQIIWVAVMVIWVIWFVTRREEITLLSRRLGTEFLDSSAALASLIVGCILLGVILVGTIVLFVFGQRQSRAIRQQRSFLSSVTHELRSPLSSLQLAFETLRSRDLDPEMRDKMLEMSLSDIERLVRLVDQILVSARLDRGILLFSEDREDIALERLVRSIGESSAHLDRQVLTRLKITCPKDLYLNAPRPALTLILGNLIENCLKYSPAGTPIEVSISIENQWIRFRIKDQGYGLSKKDRRRIFKMFHRGDDATKKAIAGTGLGLFIVREAAQVLGGKVWAESAGTGKGSTFCVDLPLETPSAEDLLPNVHTLRRSSR